MIEKKAVIAGLGVAASHVGLFVYDTVLFQPVDFGMGFMSLFQSKLSPLLDL